MQPNDSVRRSSRTTTANKDDDNRTDSPTPKFSEVTNDISELDISETNIGSGPTNSAGVQDADVTTTTIPAISTEEGTKRSTRRRVPCLKDLRNLMTKEDSTSTFLADFDPSKPRREKQKKKNCYRQDGSTGPKNVVHDEKGRLPSAGGKDLCDCLEDTCPGCHFPCPKCRSSKCGHECRQNRKFQYASVETEGPNSAVIPNKYLTTTAKK